MKNQDGLDDEEKDEDSTSSSSSSSIVLIGNSLGSLVALSAACGDFMNDNNINDQYNDNNNNDNNSGSWFLEDKIVGIGMFNCGIGLNSRNVCKEPQWNPLQRFVLERLYDVLTICIFGNIPLLTFLLKYVVTKDVIKDALLQLYACADDGGPTSRVDDELVDSFYYPSQDDGAVEALSQIYCNDAGVTPMELHDIYADKLQDKFPIHLVWGNADVVTPVNGGLGTYYSTLAAATGGGVSGMNVSGEGSDDIDDDNHDDDKSDEMRDKGKDKENNINNNVSMDVIYGGHILFDEVPHAANGAMLQWLNERVVGSP